VMNAAMLWEDTTCNSEETLLPSRMQGMRVISATEEVHEEMKEEMEITVRRTRMVSPNAAFVARKDWNARYMSHERTVSKFT